MALRCDHDQDHALAFLEKLLVALEIVKRAGGGDNRNQLGENAVLARQRIGVACCRIETVEADNGVDPVIGRCQRHLDLGDDAVGAIGMGDLVQVLAGQFEHLRLFLHGDDAQADDVAEIAQAAPGDRADAARAAGDEAANGGRMGVDGCIRSSCPEARAPPCRDRSR
jgi:hypothetical protein